ncbi:MAG: hypothetical protein RL093_751 [Pseudomonadota bacterium]
MKKPKRTPSGDTNHRASLPVVIDGRFLRDTARDAVVQFFVPLTAAFMVKPSSEQKRRRGG